MLNRWLVVIVLLYLGLGVAYSVAFPLGEAPDETEHFRYWLHIHETGELPVMSPVYEENETLEAHQPPLLYLLGAGLTSGLPIDPADDLVENSCFSYDWNDPGRKNSVFHQPDEWPPQRALYQAFYLGRWLSLLFGAGTVWLTAVIAQQICLTPRRQDAKKNSTQRDKETEKQRKGRLPLVAAALLAFNPQFIHITSSINNDVPSAFFGAATVALCGTAVLQPRRWKFGLLGVVLGLGILSKFAMIALWPLAFLAAGWSILTLLWEEIIHRGEHGERGEEKKTLSSPRLKIEWTLVRTAVVNAAIVFILPLLIGGWWYGRNWRLYGDPLMWEVTLAAKGAAVGRVGALTLADVGEFFVFNFQSYWLWFGWLIVQGPLWVYGLLLGLVLLAVAGLAWRVVSRDTAVRWHILLFSLLATAAIYASLLQYIRTINWTGYQGRLAYTAAAPIAVLLALGLTKLHRWLAVGAGAGLLALSILSLPLLILPAFPRPEIYQPAANLPQTCGRFARGLQLEGLEAEAATRSGDSLRATLHGYGLETGAGTAVLQLRHPDGRILAVAEQPVGWEAGEPFAATLAFAVPPQQSGVQGVLEAGLLTEDGGWETAVSATGRELTVPLPITVHKVAPATPLVAQPEQLVNANFADLLNLAGVEMVEENGRLRVTLWWEALAPLPHDYTTFVHLVDAEGNIVAQADSPPQNGWYPMTIWDVGEVVQGEKVIEVGGLETADLTIRIGAYWLETGERLSLVDGSAEWVTLDWE